MYTPRPPTSILPSTGKQVRSLIPLAFVEIVAIGVFEIGQGDEILSPADSAFEVHDLRLQLLQLRAKILLGRTRGSSIGASKAHATERNYRQIAK